MLNALGKTKPEVQSFGFITVALPIWSDGVFPLLLPLQPCAIPPHFG